MQCQTYSRKRNDISSYKENSVQNVAGRRNPLEVIYFDDYEKITEGNDVTEQYFLENDVLLIKKDGILSPYKAFKDVLGSILVVVDKKRQSCI